MSKNVTYQKGELVWAKIRGYPWWPGIVSKIYEDKQEGGDKRIELVINFIGENSHSRLQLDKIAKYQEKYQDYTQNVKQKKLIESIKAADQINQGKTTYDAEIKKLQKQKQIKKKASKQENENGDNSESTSNDQEDNFDLQQLQNHQTSSNGGENEFDENKVKNIASLANNNNANTSSNANNNPNLNPTTNQNSNTTNKQNSDSDEEGSEDEKDKSKKNKKSSVRKASSVSKAIQKKKSTPPSQPSENGASSKKDKQSSSSSQTPQLTQPGNPANPSQQIELKINSPQYPPQQVSPTLTQQQLAPQVSVPLLAQGESIRINLEKSTTSQDQTLPLVGSTQATSEQQQQPSQVSSEATNMFLQGQQQSIPQNLSLLSQPAAQIVSPHQQQVQPPNQSPIAVNGLQTLEQSQPASSMPANQNSPALNLIATQQFSLQTQYSQKRQSHRDQPLTKEQKFQLDIKEALTQARNGEFGDLYDLDQEFNTLLSSLINSQFQEQHIEDALNRIVSKVHTICPSPVNILDILRNDYGKSFVCLKQLLEEKKTLLENLNINVTAYLKELESFIVIFKEQLFSRFFNHTEKLQELKQLMKINGQKKYKTELGKLQNNERGGVVQQPNQQNFENEDEDENTEELASASSFSTSNKNKMAKKSSLNPQASLNAVNSKNQKSSKNSSSMNIEEEEQNGEQLQKTTQATSQIIKNFDNYNQVCQKENVKNPSLRKRICQKFYEFLQQSYPDLIRKEIIMIVLGTERKVRRVYPQMCKSYKEKMIQILKIIRAKGLDMQQIQDLQTQDLPIDFKYLNQIQQRLQKSTEINFSPQQIIIGHGAIIEQQTQYSKNGPTPNQKYPSNRSYDSCSTRQDSSVGYESDFKQINQCDDSQLRIEHLERSKYNTNNLSFHDYHHELSSTNNSLDKNAEELENGRRH